MKKKSTAAKPVYDIVISGPVTKEVVGIIGEQNISGDITVSCRKKYSKTTRVNVYIPEGNIVAVHGDIGEEGVVLVKSFGPVFETRGHVIEDVDDEGDKSTYLTDLEGNTIILGSALAALGYTLSISSDVPDEGAPPSTRGRKKAVSADEFEGSDEDEEDEDEEDEDDEDEDEDEDDEDEDDEDEDEDDEDEDEDEDEDDFEEDEDEEELPPARGRKVTSRR